MTKMTEITIPADKDLTRKLIGDTSEGQLLEVSMGPHHPSTHGVFRMDVVLDGERVLRLKPVIRLSAPEPRKDRREYKLPGVDALHGSAGLFLFADQ